MCDTDAKATLSEGFNKEIVSIDLMTYIPNTYGNH